jgi:hypothetical protein
MSDAAVGAAIGLSLLFLGAWMLQRSGARLGAK